MFVASVGNQPNILYQLYEVKSKIITNFHFMLFNSIGIANSVGGHYALWINSLLIQFELKPNNPLNNFAISPPNLLYASTSAITIIMTFNANGAYDLNADAIL